MKKFNITWTAGSDGGSAITGYDVGYTPSGGSETVVATGSTAAAYTLGGLTDGVDYSVRVRAENAEGKGSWSSAVVQTAETPPAAITDLSAAAQNATDVLLSWSAPASSPNITEYEVEYFAVAPEYAGGDNQYAPLTPNPAAGETSRQYTIPEATQSPGQSLSVSLRIRAMNVGGAAPWSNIVTVSLGA